MIQTKIKQMTLQEYNNSRLLTCDILTGPQYRNLRRKKGKK